MPDGPPCSNGAISRPIQLLGSVLKVHESEASVGVTATRFMTSVSTHEDRPNDHPRPIMGTALLKGACLVREKAGLGLLVASSHPRGPGLNRQD